MLWLGVALLLAAIFGGQACAQPAGRQSFIVVRDAETETLLRNIANPLFRAAGVDPGLVRITLLRDDAINSFVSTGNRMFINTGLISGANSVGELVGVIAHETGHIRSGHLARLPEAMQEAMLETIAATLFGAAAVLGSSQTRTRSPYRDNSIGDAGIGAMLGGQHLAIRNFLSFTRTIEAAADQGAVQFLDRLHWPAQGMLDLFRRLEHETVLTTEMQDPYLQTHPLNRSRIDFVTHHLSVSPYAKATLPAGFEPTFLMVRAKLQGFLAPSSHTLARLKSDDPSAPARYARAIALYRLGHTDDAIRLIDGLIVEQPGKPWLHELKGQVLFEGGRGAQALVPYREAVRLAPEQSQIRAALARALIETGDRAQLRPAIAELQSALAREADDQESWRALGTAWGRLGDLGQANLALAEEAMILGDIPRANILAGKAEKLLPAGQARMRASDISNAVKRENRKGF